MRKRNFSLKSIIPCALILTCASLAHAQQRTFVSGTGNDANDCLRLTPCRNFQRGHDAVAAGGEVVALDSGGYGTLTITKSVTITGEGVRAALTATSGNGVDITAAGATVVLRELTLTGNGTGSDGVLVNDAAAVHIERCVITSFSSDGIDYRTNNRLFISDTVSRSNSGSGLRVAGPAGGTARINVDHSRFEQNGTNGIDFNESAIEASITNSILSDNSNDGLGIDTANVSHVQVEHSTAANNGSNGFHATGSGASQLHIEYSVARGNTASGMRVTNGATIRVSNSVSTNNAIGFDNVGGTLESRLNNTVAANTNPNVGVTSFTAQ